MTVKHRRLDESGLRLAVKEVGLACDTEVDCFFRCAEAGYDVCMTECWMAMPIDQWLSHARRHAEAKQEPVLLAM